MKKVWSIVLAASVGGLVAVGVTKITHSPETKSFEEKQEGIRDFRKRHQKNPAKH